MIVHDKSATLSAVAYFLGRRGNVNICRVLKVLDPIYLYALNEATPCEHELAACRMPGVSHKLATWLQPLMKPKPAHHAVLALTHGLI